MEELGATAVLPRVLPGPLRIGDRLLAWGARTYVMSVLNVTPDSFAEQPPAVDPEIAIERGRRAIAEGADILDIGGESTRPGAQPVDAATELRRMMPVVERLADETDVPISVDTTKAEVADAALRAGAAIVNDIHGLRHDPRLAAVVAEHDAAVVVMANLRGCTYADVIEAAIGQLRESIAIALRAGIAAERIIVDPGFGFGPRPAENLEMIRRLATLHRLGRPVLIGTSRKSTIGLVLDLPVAERLEGTAATVALAIANGADIVRVHDTRPMLRVARMADAIIRGWQEPHADPREQTRA